MMNCWDRKGIAFFAIIVAVIALLVAPKATVFAHGGEDHGDQPAPAVSKGANMITRVARVGDLEVVLKHPPVEPDKELVARLFVTHFATNEPVGGAKISVAFTGVGAPVEATATPGQTPGMYEVKLPPLPKGRYKVVARVNHDGADATADYGALQVAPLPAASVETMAPWARTALIGLALLVGLGLIGAVIYRIAQGTRSSRMKGETATA